MAIYDSFDESRKRIVSGRVVKYSAVPVYQKIRGVNLLVYWEITRSSKMAYRYLGLTEEAANAGADELRRAFTRKYMRWTAEVSEGANEPIVTISERTVYECTSEIQPVPAGGGNWEIGCSIDETDSIISLEPVNTYEDLERYFALAEQREGGGGSGGSIAIVAAAWKSSRAEIDAEFSAVIPNFNPRNLVALVKSGETWTELPTSVDGQTATFAAQTNATFKLKHGDIESLEWTTRNAEEPTFALIGVTYTEQKVHVADGAWGWIPSFLATFEAKGLVVTAKQVEMRVLHPGYYIDRINSSALLPLGANRYQITGPRVDVPIAGTTVYLAHKSAGIATSAMAPTDGSAVKVSSVSYVGAGAASDTYRFKAAFSTDLTPADVLAASVLGIATNTASDRIGANVTIAQTSDGVYEIAADVLVTEPGETLNLPFFVAVTSGGVTSYSVRKFTPFAPPLVSVTASVDGPAGREIDFSFRGSAFDPSKLTVEKMNVVANPSTARVASTWESVATTSVEFGKAYLAVHDNAVYRVVYDGEPSAPYIPAGTRAVDLRRLTASDGTLTASVTAYGDGATQAYLVAFTGGQYLRTVGEMTRTGDVYEIAAPTDGDAYCVTFRYNTTEWCSSVALEPEVVA